MTACPRDATVTLLSDDVGQVAEWFGSDDQHPAFVNQSRHFTYF